MKWILTSFILFLWSSPFEAACGCEQMRLRAATPGNSTTYCTDDQADISDPCFQVGQQGQEPCTDEQWAYRCPLGGFSVANGDGRNVGWAFEIAVTLTDESVPAECNHGQFATRTGLVGVNISPNQTAERTPEQGFYSFLNGASVVVFSDPQRYPAFGSTCNGLATFGADGYDDTESQQNLNIGDQAPQITWIDTPDFNWDQGETGSVSWEFIAWSDDTDGDDECWCRFTINRTWDGNVAGGNGLVFVGGENCVNGNG